MDIAMLAAALVFLSPFVGATSYVAATRVRCIAKEQDSCHGTKAARARFLPFCDRIDLTQLLISAGVLTVVVSATCLTLPHRDVLFGVAFVWLLGALVIFDCLQRRLPNALTASLGILGLAMAALNGMFVEAAIGVALGGAGPLLVKLAYRHYFRRSGLGGGDVKLLAACGAWVGGGGISCVLSLASIAALLCVGLSGGANRHRVIAFGPYISAAAFCIWSARALGLWII